MLERAYPPSDGLFPLADFAREDNERPELTDIDPPPPGMWHQFMSYLLGAREPPS